MINVNVVLEEGVKMPSYANKGDAGIDIYPKENVIIPAGAKGFLIKTGIKIELPNDYELQIRPKSGNSIKTSIRVILGTIDSGYRGEIGIIVDNISEYEINISKTKAIAQGVLNYVPKIKFNLVDDLSDSDRGNGGFGSTGRGI